MIRLGGSFPTPMSFILPHVLDVFFGLSANVCYPIIFCITLCKLLHINVEFLAFEKDTSGNGRICGDSVPFCLIACSLSRGWRGLKTQLSSHCFTTSGVMHQQGSISLFSSLQICFHVFKCLQRRNYGALAGLPAIDQPYLANTSSRHPLRPPVHQLAVILLAAFASLLGLIHT